MDKLSNLRWPAYQPSFPLPHLVPFFCETYPPLTFYGIMTQRAIMKLSKLVYHFLSKAATAASKQNIVARNIIAASLYCTKFVCVLEH